MTRNATRRLVIPVVFGLVCGACADCPPTPEQVVVPATAGDRECDWVVSATVTGKRDLVCVIAGTRIVFDTTGVGEGK